MKHSKVWLVTGAGSGIGLEIAKAALAGGNKVIATGRDANKVTKAIGDPSGNLFVIKMDVTNPKEIAKGIDSALYFAMSSLNYRIPE